MSKASNTPSVPHGNAMQQAIANLQADGFCGALSPAEDELCIRDAGHSEPHIWKSDSPDVEALVATVREALWVDGQPELIYTSALAASNMAALAALDALASEIQRLNDHWQELEHPFDRSEFDAMAQARDDAIAALRQLQESGSAPGVERPTPPCRYEADDDGYTERKAELDVPAAEAGWTGAPLADQYPPPEDVERAAGLARERGWKNRNYR